MIYQQMKKITTLLWLSLIISLSFNFSTNINFLTTISIFWLSFLWYIWLKELKKTLNSNNTDEEIEKKNNKLISTSKDFINFDKQLKNFLLKY